MEHAFQDGEGDISDVFQNTGIQDLQAMDDVLAPASALAAQAALYDCNDAGEQCQLHPDFD